MCVVPTVATRHVFNPLHINKKARSIDESGEQEDARACTTACGDPK